MASGRFLILPLITLLGCAMPDDEKFSIFSQTYDFDESAWGWQGDVTDYPISESDTDDSQPIHWESDYTLSPNGLVNVLKLECENSSSGTFLYITKKVSGLAPKRTYNLVFDVKVFCNVPPTESPILKAGAVSFEPEKLITDNHYDLNLDKGESDDESGKDMIVLGHLSFSPTENSYGYSSISNSTTGKQFKVTANEEGEIWLVVGTELPSKGMNTILYRQIEVVFSGPN